MDKSAECPAHYSLPLVVSQSAEQIAALCRSFNDTPTSGMEGLGESQDSPPRPLARHLSDADRLRKVIQELLDTEKSYVKVTEDAVRFFLLFPPVCDGQCVLAGVPRLHLSGTPPCMR